MVLENLVFKKAGSLILEKTEMAELREQNRRMEIQLAEKLELPVFGLLGDHIKDGAKIVWQDDAFCLFASTGEDLAYGKTIGDLLVSLIMREC